MSEQFQLITLFQQNMASGVNTTGFKYKLESSSNFEVDVPFSSFTSFIDGLLSYINSTNIKYVKERDAAYNANSNFDPSTYGAVILEKIDKSMIPIIVDVNFLFSNTGDMKFFHDKFIYQCIYHLQGIILSIFKVPHDDSGFNKVLTCFVLESHHFLKDDKVSLKVRFQFPYAKINIEHLNKVLIKKFREVIVEENIIKSYVMQTPLNSIEKMIPDIGEYVSLYCSKQSKDESPLILRNVYSFIEDPYNLEDDYDDERVLKFLIPYMLQANEISFFEVNMNNDAFKKEPDYTRYKHAYELEPMEHTLIKSNYIDADYLDKNQRLYNLPLILSVHFCSDILQIDSCYQLTPSFLPEVKLQKFNSGAAVNDRLDKVQMLAQLLPMIGKHRFTEYYKHDWKSIGKTIHTIYKGSPQGLKVWKLYTTDIELNFDCEFMYNNFNSEMLDIRTIRHYASIDNNAAYEAWNRQIYYPKIELALSLQEIDFIEFAIHILCLKFVYDRNNGTWYYFNGVRLVADPEGSVLFDHLRPINDNPGNDLVMKAIYAFQDEHRELSRNDKTRAGKSTYDGIEKQVSALIRSLSTMRFLNKVKSALQVYMYDDYLYRKTDENPDIMACNNCILECIDDKIIYREGKLQDYITKSTNIDFPYTYTMDNYKVQFMLKYYSQVHTDPELCHFFLKTLASLLRGGNAEKYFINWIGEANASKSQVLKFLQAALGDYCTIIPNHIITLNINANTGKPEPAIERGKGSRVWVAAETDRSEKWHVGHVKKFTSNDDYDNRTLHKEGGIRSASFQLIGMSNIDLDAPNADEAYYSRYVKIPFLSKWVDNAPSTEAEQIAQRRFPIDLIFSSKISVYAQAQLYLMYAYYPIYKKEGIRSLPDIVKTVTLKHQRDLDVIFNFLTDRCNTYYIGDSKEKVLDRSHATPIFELHRIYKSWYRQAYGTDVIPLDQFKFRDEMSRRIGEPTEHGFWYGIEPKSIQNHNSSI